MTRWQTWSSKRSRLSSDPADAAVADTWSGELSCACSVIVPPGGLADGDYTESPHSCADHRKSFSKVSIGRDLVLLSLCRFCLCSFRSLSSTGVNKELLAGLVSLSRLLQICDLAQAVNQMATSSHLPLFAPPALVYRKAGVIIPGRVKPAPRSIQIPFFFIQGGALTCAKCMPMLLPKALQKASVEGRRVDGSPEGDKFLLCCFHRLLQ